MGKELEKRISDLGKELANDKRVSDYAQHRFQRGEHKGILKGVFGTLAFIAVVGVSGYFINKCDCSSVDPTTKIGVKLPKDDLIDTVKEFHNFLGIDETDSEKEKEANVLAFQEQCYYTLGLKVTQNGKLSEDKRKNLRLYAAANIVKDDSDLLKKLQTGIEYHDWTNQFIGGYSIKIPKIAEERAKEFSKEHPDLDVIIDYKDPIIRKLAKRLIHDSKTDKEKAERILEFVQAIPYDYDVGKNYVRHPIQTLGDNGGNCGDKTGLYVSLAKAVGLDAKSIWFENKIENESGHLSGGIVRNFDKNVPPSVVLHSIPRKPNKFGVETEKTTCYVEQGKKKYFFAETTDYSKTGECPDDLAKWKKPVIVDVKPVSLFNYIKNKNK